jgi:predicted small metal-binding protein
MGRSCVPQEDVMAKTYSYACADYPGMETCVGRFQADTAEEVWKHIELHASVAHNEDPASWPSEERAKLKALVKIATRS